MVRVALGLLMLLVVVGAVVVLSGSPSLERSSPAPTNEPSPTASSDQGSRPGAVDRSAPKPALSPQPDEPRASDDPAGTRAETGPDRVGSRADASDGPRAERSSTGRSPRLAGSKGRPSGAEADGVRWPVDAQGIQGAVNEASPQLRDCLSEWLKVSPGLGGRADVELTIAPDPDNDTRGKVTSVRMVRSELQHTFVEGCIANTLAGLPFDRPAGEVSVRLPFMLTAPDAGAAGIGIDAG